MIDGADELLPILIFDDVDGWESLKKLAGPHLDTAGLKRLQHALDGAAATVMAERHYIDKDYRETFSSFHSKKFHTPDARCVRLHFFSGAIERAALHAAAAALQTQYLGYCVLRPIRPNCIGRTMLSPKSRRGLFGNLSLCSETVNIQGVELHVTGFPFISQDGDATVCAQSTLWMLIRYFSNRYPAYPEMYPVQIGELTRDYSVGRLFPTTGLYVWQMAEALRQAKFASVIYSRNAYSSRFDHVLYTYIESGIPVLAAFKNHVVVLLGHQSDYSLAASAIPEEGSPFVFSSSFNQAYIGNDDNGVPYQILRKQPRAAEWEEMRGAEHYFAIDEIEQFIAPLPERVFLAAENVESLVTAILESTVLGYANCSPMTAAETPLLRIFLTTGRGFKNKLRQRQGMGHPRAEATYRELPLPHFIWVCEISHPSLYPDKVLGEVLWDATRNPHELGGFLAVHYPELLVIDEGSALNGHPNLLQFRLDGGVPYPIYTHNLRETTG